MNPIEMILKEKHIMYLDGGTATELEQRGCDINDSLWSAKILLENEQVIRDVHYDYLKSGSDACISNSYQATVKGFMARGLSEGEAKRLIAHSVTLALEARDQFWAKEKNRAGRLRPVVAASIGPYGAYLADGSEYTGAYGIGKEELSEFHRERMAILVAAGAELLACETLPSLTEALVLAELLKNHPEMTCWISFSCKNARQISDGTPIEECARALNAYPQVSAVGVNCLPPEFVEELVERLKSTTDKPIVVYPNSGEQYDPVAKEWHGPADGVSFAERALLWSRAGASLIGGCCRTTPQDIQNTATLLQQ